MLASINQRATMNIDKEKEREWQDWCDQRREQGAYIPPWFSGMFAKDDADA
jgi:hypothetical protein